MDNINSTKMQGESELSKIQSFYTDTTVFLTGATGFMGNLILEKLIRTCSGVKKVYILVREKKGKTAEERFKELFEDYIFSVMKKEQPDYLNKISAIIGDCSSPNLGIAEKDQEILKNEVNIIIHCAATVKFDEHLRIAVNINILALQDLLKLGKKIKNLKAFVHISTAYSNCAGRKVVDEVFYKPPISGDSLSKVCQSLDDSYITEITPIILREWPNTYALTKAIAEGEILIYGKGLPVGIIRPSMIVATDKEPLPGWINNVYGPTGIIMATGIGVVRVTLGKHNGVADIIPGDIVSNAVLASAWDIHNQWMSSKHVSTMFQHKNLQISESFTPPIFNIVSSSSNPVTWGDFSEINIKYGKEMPSKKAIWPIMMRITSNKYEYMVLRFLLHTLPGLLIDLLAVLIGKKPKLTKSYKKIHKFVDVLSYFSMRSWTFNDDNTRSLIGRMSKLDQSLFNFDISNLNWDDYFKRHVEGLVKYLLKDTDEDSLEKGRKHMRRLYMIHYIITVMLAVSFFLILYGLIAWFV